MTTTQLQFLLAFAQSSQLATDPDCDILATWKHLSRFLNPYEGNGASSLSWEAGGAEAGKAAGAHYWATGCPLTVGWDEWPKPAASPVLPSSRRPSPAQFQQHQIPSIGWGSN